MGAALPPAIRAETAEPVLAEALEAIITYGLPWLRRELSASIET